MVLAEIAQYVHTESKYNPEITLDSVIGKQRASSLKSRPWFTQDVSDTVANNAYSIVVGSGLDIIGSGLGPGAWVASRVEAMVWNLLTAALYGRYRDAMFRWTHTTDNSSLARKGLVDFVAFNSFQTPVYAGAVAFATWLFEDGLDMAKVKAGALSIALLSPFISPTFNWTYDKCREFFGFATFAQKASSANSSV